MFLDGSHWEVSIITAGHAATPGGAPATFGPATVVFSAISSPDRASRRECARRRLCFAKALADTLKSAGFNRAQARAIKNSIKAEAVPAAAALPRERRGRDPRHPSGFAARCTGFPGAIMILLSFIRSPCGYADMIDATPLRFHYFPQKGCSAPSEGRIRDENAIHRLRFC